MMRTAVAALTEAREGLLSGWGPDYTEVEICCPRKPCTWGPLAALAITVVLLALGHGH